MLEPRGQLKNNNSFSSFVSIRSYMYFIWQHELVVKGHLAPFCRVLRYFWQHSVVVYILMSAYSTLTYVTAQLKLVITDEASDGVNIWRMARNLGKNHQWSVLALCHHAIKVRKRAGIDTIKPHNQVPHLTQDTNGKVATSQLDITNESQEVSPFPAGDHKASTNRHAWKHNKTRQQ